MSDDFIRGKVHVTLSQFRRNYLVGIDRGIILVPAFPKVANFRSISTKQFPAAVALL